MSGGEVVALAFPCEIDGAKFEWWCWVSFGLRIVNVEPKRGVDVRSIGAWWLVMYTGKRVVNVSYVVGFDEVEDSL